LAADLKGSAAKLAPRTVSGPAHAQCAPALPLRPLSVPDQHARGSRYEILVRGELRNWIALIKGTALETTFEYVDSEASKLGRRFYRGLAAGAPATTLPPGFSMIANPCNAPDNRVSAPFSEWSKGTTLDKFDTRRFRLSDHRIKHKACTRLTHLFQAKARFLSTPHPTIFR